MGCEYCFVRRKLNWLKIMIVFLEGQVENLFNQLFLILTKIHK